METKELFFTWKDVKRIFKRKRKAYLSLAIRAFIAASCLFLSGPLRYLATATFKESKQEYAMKGQSELLLSVLQTASSFSKEEGVQSMFMSRTLLRQVIETLGLQVQKKEFFF